MFGRLLLALEFELLYFNGKQGGLQVGPQGEQVGLAAFNLGGIHFQGVFEIIHVLSFGFDQRGLFRDQRIQHLLFVCSVFVQILIHILNQGIGDGIDNGGQLLGVFAFQFDAKVFR